MEVSRSLVGRWTTFTAGAMILAFVAPPGFSDVSQVRLGVKGATCAT